MLKISSQQFRFDDIAEMRFPEEEDRKKILVLHLKRHKLDSKVNLGEFAKQTYKFSGGDLALVAGHAAFEAHKKKHTSIDDDCIKEGINIVKKRKEKSNRAKKIC